MTKQSKTPAIYIITNARKGVLYTGVTSDLMGRIYQHKQGMTKGFSHRYHCTKLVYYEMRETMEAAIVREKQIKSGSRKKKINLVEAMNPEWADLYESLF